MKLDEAIKIKYKYQYILRGAFLQEVLEADNLSIEALKRIQDYRSLYILSKHSLLPSETLKKE